MILPHMFFLLPISSGFLHPSDPPIVNDSYLRQMPNNILVVGVSLF